MRHADLVGTPQSTGSSVAGHNVLARFLSCAATLAVAAFVVFSSAAVSAEVYPYPVSVEAGVMAVFSAPVTDDVIEDLLREARSDERAALVFLVVLEKLGRLDEVEQALDDFRSLHSSPWLAAMSGAFLTRRGQSARAIEALEPIAETDDGEVAQFATYWRARAFESSGRESRSELEFRDLIRAANRDSASPDELLLGALGAHAIGRFQDANELFRRTLDAHPESVQVRVAWASLFERKYRADEASRLLEEAVERGEFDPTTLADLAWLLIEHANQAQEATEFSTRATAVNLNHPVAHLVRARISMDAREFTEAAQLLADVTVEYPLERRIDYLIAASLYLAGEDERFAAMERELLQKNPRDAAFYHTVAEAAARVFRYPEALRLSETAIMRNPDFAPAYLSAAFGYSRVGEDEKTLSYLRRAFDRDPYNVMAYNMVNLWEQTFEHYSVLEDTDIPSLRYRIANRELPVLSQLVPPVVQTAWREYVQRYEYEPEPPVSFEVFSDSETFGIRSVGLPNVGLHGICFGHVVTARSPSEGNFNYRVVYEHELSHVFTLQYTDYRVPRWLSEGMAEYDTWATNHSWRRTEDIALLTRLQAGQLVSVVELDLAFLRSRSGADMIAAYFQSFMVTRFIVDTYEHDGLLSLLRAYGDGLSTADAIEYGLGVTSEQFDAEFEVWLRNRYAPMLGNFEPSIAVWTSMSASQDEFVRARAGAAGLIVNGARAEARTAIDALEVLDPERGAEVAFLRGALATQIGRGQLAFDQFKQAYEASGAPSYTLSFALGEMALDKGESAQALEFLEAAAAAYPMGPRPHHLLAQMHDRSGDAQRAAESWRQVFERDSNDFEAAYRTATWARSSGALDLALKASERATNIQPFNADALRLRIELLQSANQQDEADRLSGVLRTVVSGASVGD